MRPATNNLTKYEALFIQAEERYFIREEPMKAFDGLYCGNCIQINSRMSERKKYTTLAEEMAHGETCTRNILDYNDIYAMKNERQARIMAYEALVPIEELDKIMRHGSTGVYELAEEFDVNEEFMQNVLEYYGWKYEGKMRECDL